MSVNIVEVAECWCLTVFDCDTEPSMARFEYLCYFDILGWISDINRQL